MTNIPTCPCGHPIRVSRSFDGEISVELTADGPKTDMSQFQSALVFSCTRAGCTEDLDEDLCDEVQELVENHLTA